MLISIVKKFFVLWGSMCLTLGVPFSCVAQHTTTQAEYAHRLFIVGCLIAYPLAALAASILLTLLRWENGSFLSSTTTNSPTE